MKQYDHKKIEKKWPPSAKASAGQAEKKLRTYDHKRIEKKWQKAWAKKKAHVVKDSVKGKKNEYLLVEFPYPSGNLHVGHWYAFAIPDIYARYRRAQGRNVLYPIGFDAFGLPAENAAIKRSLNPRTWTQQNIKYMKGQLASMGASFDWSREVATIDPAYYKWTQWMFTQFYKKGLAYQKETPANWCPKDKTVLANEQVVNGHCERCGAEVEQRMMLQWNLRITEYADRLVDDLEKLDWPTQIKDSQRNWIGRSEGAEILFPLQFPVGADKLKYVLLHGFKGDVSNYDWLKSELEKLGHEVIVPHLPNASSPNEKEWVEAILGATTYDKNTVLFGYSLGAVAAMKALEKLDTKIAALVLAGGFVDPKFKDHSRNFEKKFSWKFDAITITSKVGHIHLLHDTTDTAISEDQARRLSECLGIPLTRVEAQKPHFCGDKELVLLNYLTPSVTVFTTRPDTLYGATYIVLAPEHPLLRQGFAGQAWVNQQEVNEYVTKANKKSDLERQESKEKTGVRIDGVEAINPATGETIPVFVADYVLGHYGTGAVMAVPAHDERDFEFAKKFGLPIRHVVLPVRIDEKNPHVPGKEVVFRNLVMAIVRNPQTGKYLALKVKNPQWTTFVIGGVEEGESLEEAARREIREESGYVNVKLVRALGGPIHSEFHAGHKGVNRIAHNTTLLFELEDEVREPLAPEEAEKHEVTWLNESEITRDRMSHGELDIVLNRMRTGNDVHSGQGILAYSGTFDSMPSEEAKKAITAKFGRAKKTYRLRDWGVSRQRYWGVPIPIIHCDTCGAVPVPDKDLPVKLPEVKDYLPAGNGKSPLAKAVKWVNVKCPKCKGKAQRETDTLDTFVDSSWYFLRYVDPKNKKSFADKKKQSAWMPIDLYSGGAEHTTMHLLYSRFWYKALYDLKLVKDKEPYVRRMNRGLILGPDGQKMSKRWNNVIDPDDIVAQLGADTLRLYLAFIGPYNEPGSYPWNPDGVAGVRRFLERTWRLQDKIVDDRRNSFSRPGPGETVSPEGRPEIERELHKMIKKVGEDCAELKFNTAIAAMMTFLNTAEGRGLTKQQYVTLVRLLAPFAPHITEELWASFAKASKAKHAKNSVHLQPWPKYDKKKLVSDTVKIIIQINGKMRGEAQVPASADKEAVEAAARAVVADRLAGENVARVIIVPGRLINFVTLTIKKQIV